MKDFTLYPEAFGLKELGFDEPCLTYIYIGDTGNNYNVPCAVLPSKAKNFNEDDLCISTPTYSQAFRWFREKKKLHGEPFSQNRPNGNFMHAFKIAGTDIMYDGYKTYEEAELACLKKLIEIVKKPGKEILAEQQKEYTFVPNPKTSRTQSDEVDVIIGVNGKRRRFDL